MKIIAFTGGKSLEEEGAFVSIEQDMPKADGYDLLVEIKAIAVNPIDTKVRKKQSEPLASPLVLGWDAAGVVIDTGDKVSHFRAGDRVFYAGDVTRPGCNASHQLIDERLVGNAPESLNFEQAAALPLTSITAWECLFERLRIDQSTDAGKHILIIGGAGGVGSIAIQLAKKVAGLRVTATASRDETRDWCKRLGADNTVNHHADMVAEFEQQSLPEPDYILCLNSTDRHFKTMIELIKPQGLICSIVDVAEPVDINLLKPKCIGFMWEMMFAKSMFQTKDMRKQHYLLQDISRLIDDKTIETTLKEILGPMTVENIAKAHQLIEAGNSIGKIVLTA